MGLEWVDGVAGKARETMPKETSRREDGSQWTDTGTREEGPGADSKLHFGFCSQEPRRESP